MSPREAQLPTITLFFIYFYFLVCTVTLAATTGCLVEQKKLYDLICSYDTCFTYYILEPILCFGVSFVGFLTAVLQVSLYHSRRLWGRRFFVVNVMTTLLWVAVITIGWVPNPSFYSDLPDIYTTNFSISAIGWLAKMKDSYNYYHNYYYQSFRPDATEVRIGFGFAVVILSATSLGCAALLALYAIIVYLGGRSRAHPGEDTILGSRMTPIVPAQQWSSDVQPEALHQQLYHHPYQQPAAPPILPMHMQTVYKPSQSIVASQFEALPSPSPGPYSTPHTPVLDQYGRRVSPYPGT